MLVMSNSGFDEQGLSKVECWNVEDVCRWFSSLSLSQDYSSILKELTVTGQVLLNFNSTALLNTIGILHNEDQHTLTQAIDKIRQHTPPTSSSSSTSSASPAISPTLSSVTRPLGGRGGTRTILKLQGDDDGTSSSATKTTHRLKTGVKSKSLDELLNEGFMSGATPVVVNGTRAVLDNPYYSSHLFDVLREENVSLKKELECYYERVSRLQKLELELQQLQDSYRLLEGTSSRKAKLEKAMRERLEEELLRMKQTQAQQKAELHSIKRTTQQQHIGGTTAGMVGVGVTPLILQDQFSKRDKESVIKKLLLQNEETISLREKLESNLQFAKTALEENASHGNTLKRRSEPEPLLRRKASPRNSLDNGISNSDENDLARTYLLNLEGLQSLLTAMQTSSDNRQRLEQQLRKHLEDRVKELEAGIDSHREQTEDQELRIATLEADLAQMEQKCSELLAEKQLAMNETIKQSRLSLMEHHCNSKEEELKTVKMQRDVCMAQLDNAQQAIIKLERRIRSLECSLQEKQSLVERLQAAAAGSSSNQQYHFHCDEPLGYTSSEMMRHEKLKGVVSRPNGTVQSHCIRRTSSPLPPYPMITTGLSVNQTTNTTTTVGNHNPPPTLPSYDQHLHTRHHQYSSHRQSPVPSYHGEMSSHSFPNTPETIRRRNTATAAANNPSDNSSSFYGGSPAMRTSSGTSLSPAQGIGGFCKSLTPPPLYYPPKHRPPLITSHSLSQSSNTNGGLAVPPRNDYYLDTDSVDSFELLLNSSSPSSLSPPSRYQISRNCYSFSSSSGPNVHEHSNSFPSSSTHK